MPENSGSAPILWKVEGRIGHLILNSQPANQMDAAFFESLGRIVDTVIPRSELDALLVYGAGRHFSSGAALSGITRKFLAESEFDALGEIVRYSEALFRYTEYFWKISRLDLPVIAAVRGVCIGSALELALSCHVLIAAESSTLGSPEVSFGLMPGCGGTRLLTGRVGAGKALQLILQGNTLSAQEAYSLGLVDAVLPTKDFLEGVTKIVNVIADRRRRGTVSMEMFCEDPLHALVKHF